MNSDQADPGTSMSDPPQAIPLATPVQTEDEGIYCPICNYNLTGIRTGRCPECGSFFDREALRHAQSTNKVTLIPWDDPQPMPFFKRLKETLKICLFVPQRFAFAFSVQPRGTRAWTFFLGVIAVINLCAMGFFIVATVLNPALTRLSGPGLVLRGVSFGLFSTLLIGGTSLLSAIALWITSPHYDGQRHLRPWLSICAYASSHYLLVLVVMPFALFAANSESLLPILVMLAFLLFYACGGLTGFTLHAVMEHRTARDRRSMLSSLMLLAVYVVGPFAMMIVAGVIIGFIEHYVF